MIFQITTLFVTDIGFDYIAPNPTGDDLTSFFETVVLLSKGEIDSKKVRVEFSLENMDMSGFQKGATANLYLRDCAETRRQIPVPRQ